MIKSFVICSFTRCYKNDQIKEDEMSKLGRMHVKKRCVQAFGGKSWLKETLWIM